MIDYVLLDVFTDRAYTGNPLAVVLDADDLSTSAMHAVANELNLSETVFVGSQAADGSWPTSIHTPQVELPFAGHPTVGAAIALSHAGRLDPDGSCVLAEQVGHVAAQVETAPGQAASARFAVPRPPELVGQVDPARAAHLAGLTSDDLLGGVPPAEWSAGVPFVVVAVRDLDLLARATPAPDAEHLYVVTPVDGSPSDATTWRARMFAPAMGIAEDPATGAAASAFAGQLAAIDGSGAPERSWVVAQGVEMGRPSRIEVGVRREGSTLTAHIGGRALIVGSGRLVHPHGET